MKRLVKDENLCIGCGKCEEVCSNAFFRESNAAKSCVRVQEIEENKHKLTICNQCGKCIEVCPVQALTRDSKGIIRLNKKDCVGCFMCVGFCPDNAMMQHDDYIEPFKCIACGLCVKSCPTGALKIVED